MPLVLLGDEEPYKLGVGHLALFLRRTTGHSTREDAVNHASGNGWKGNEIKLSIPLSNLKCAHRTCAVGPTRESLCQFPL
jgi:hypothetical protein